MINQTDTSLAEAFHSAIQDDALTAQQFTDKLNEILTSSDNATMHLAEDPELPEEVLYAVVFKDRSFFVFYQDSKTYEVQGRTGLNIDKSADIVRLH